MTLRRSTAAEGRELLWGTSKTWITSTEPLPIPRTNRVQSHDSIVVDLLRLRSRDVVQYSEASMIVSTRTVWEGSLGSSLPLVSVRS